VLSFELRDAAQRADDFMRRTTIPIMRPSLGGVHTLLTRPATTLALGMSRDERLSLVVSDDLIRMSVGIEATEIF